MRIFGSTQYIRTDVSDSSLLGNYPDVEPFEEYLQLSVKSQWDFNSRKYHLIYKDYTYFISLCAKKDNNTYHKHQYLKTEDLTKEYKELIESYFKNATKQ